MDWKSLNPFRRRNADGFVRIGVSHFRNRDFGKALDAFSKAISVDPSNPFYRYNRGVARCYNKEFSQAIEDFTEAIQRDAHVVDFHCWRGFALQQIQETDRAIADYSQAVHLIQNDENASFVPCQPLRFNNQITPESSSTTSELSMILLSRGSAFAAKKDFARAISDYTDALENSPEYTDALYRRAVALQQQEHFDDAISDYSNFIKMVPNFADAYFNRATASMLNNDIEQAIKDFSKYIEINPDDFQAHLWRANCWIKIGDISKWMSETLHLLEEFPEEGDAYNSLAWFLATFPDEKHRDGRSAIEYATKACELSDWKVEHHLGTLAASYAEVGDFKTAVKWAETALELAARKEPAKQRLERYLSHQTCRQDVSQWGR